MISFMPSLLSLECVETKEEKNKIGKGRGRDADGPARTSYQAAVGVRLHVTPLDPFRDPAMADGKLDSEGISE